MNGLDLKKYRYIIHGVPKNKKYTIEEAFWNEKIERFEKEMIHVGTVHEIKKWLGYMPLILGTIKTTIWFYFPQHVLEKSKYQSPFLLWQNNKDAFIPYSLEKLRHYEL
jgi:hypothetical protein